MALGQAAKASTPATFASTAVEGPARSEPFHVQFVEAQPSSAPRPPSRRRRRILGALVASLPRRGEPRRRNSGSRGGGVPPRILRFEYSPASKSPPAHAACPPTRSSGGDEQADRRTAIDWRQWAPTPPAARRDRETWRAEHAPHRFPDTAGLEGGTPAKPPVEPQRAYLLAIRPGLVSGTSRRLPALPDQGFSLA